MYDPSNTEIGLVIVLQLGIGIVLLSEVVDGVHGYDTLIGLGGQIVGMAMALGVTVILLRGRRFGMSE